MSDTTWKTKGGLLIHVPDYIVKNAMRSYSSDDTDELQFVGTRVENSYNISRIFRSVSVFLCFFLLDNPWLSIPISLACFSIGYLYMLVCDRFPLSILVDFFGMIYGLLFRFLLIPISVFIVSLVTKQYLFIGIYLLSVIVSFIYRFIFDTVYMKHFNRVYGVTYSPVDSKVSHILYRYGAHRRYNNYRSYFIYLVSLMSVE